MHIAYSYHDQGTMADVYSVQLPGYNVPGFAVETSENSFPLASLYKTLNIHTYIHTYVCMHYAHVYIHACVHTCIQMRVCMYTCAQLDICSLIAITTKRFTIPLHTPPLPPGVFDNHPLLSLPPREGVCVRGGEVVGCPSTSRLPWDRPT